MLVTVTWCKSCCYSRIVFQKLKSITEVSSTILYLGFQFTCVELFHDDYDEVWPCGGLADDIYPYVE